MRNFSFQKCSRIRMYRKKLNETDISEMATCKIILKLNSFCTYVHTRITKDCSHGYTLFFILLSTFIAHN